MISGPEAPRYVEVEFQRPEDRCSLLRLIRRLGSGEVRCTAPFC